MLVIRGWNAGRLDHPHILLLLDSGDADGLLYYVMPYVDGESLRDRLAREKQLPLQRLSTKRWCARWRRCRPIASRLLWSSPPRSRAPERSH